MASPLALPPAGSPSSVRVEFESRPETLALVRAVLAAVSEQLAIDAELLDDLRTAVSEACNNVVQHAYPGGSGPLRLELSLVPEAVVVFVRDSGVGLDERGLGSDVDAGVGIPVIRALADEVRVTALVPGGTELAMAFALERGGKPLIGRPLVAVSAVPDLVPEQATPPPGEISGSVSPLQLLGPVLGRLSRTLAAASHFSLDRFSDVYLVTDAIGALMNGAAAAGRGWFTLLSSPQRLELVAGPLVEGSIQRLRAVAAATARPSALLGLSDELKVERLPGGGERLHVVVADSAKLG